MCRSHLTVNWYKIMSKEENKDPHCYYLYAVLIVQHRQRKKIDKVVELPFTCMKKITPKESYVCLYSGHLFKS